jgi:hypothetical protein
MANNSFSELFPENNVENIITTSSDHFAIRISLLSDLLQSARPPVQQGFRYEAAWRWAEDYGDLVKGSWAPNNARPNALHATWAGLHSLAGSLTDWSKHSFGSVRREIQKWECKLRHLRTQDVSEDVLAKEKEAERHLCELFEWEEIMARQRSRVEWLQEGDRNTAFFFAKASARKKTNRITALAREDGLMCNDQNQIKGMVHEFYEDLFTSEPLVTMDSVLDAIPEKVDDHMNEELCKPYFNEEIKAALF